MYYSPEEIAFLHRVHNFNILSRIAGGALSIYLVVSKIGSPNTLSEFIILMAVGALASQIIDKVVYNIGSRLWMKRFKGRIE